MLLWEVYQNGIRKKNYNENLIVFAYFMQNKNVSFCAVASVGKLCLKFKAFLSFKKQYERFWQEAILHNV
jgi:hypothetical protein